MAQYHPVTVAFIQNEAEKSKDGASFQILIDKLGTLLQILEVGYVISQNFWIILFG